MLHVILRVHYATDFDCILDMFYFGFMYPMVDLHIFYFRDLPSCFTVFEFRTAVGISRERQDRVSGGVSILCLLAAPVANVLWKSLNLVIKESVIRCNLETRSQAK